MILSTVRTAAAALALGATADDVVVVDHLPDQVAIPAVLVWWGDPMVTHSTLCFWAARVELIVLAGRIEPGGQLDTLEEIVAALIVAFRASGVFTVTEATAPYPLELAGVTYLAASVNVQTDVEE